MRKLYDKIFSIKFFNMFLKIPVLSKLLTYEVLSYLFFGVMTTVVNFGVFYVSDKILGNGALADFAILGNVFKVTLKMFQLSFPGYLQFCLLMLPISSGYLKVKAGSLRL